MKKRAVEVQEKVWMAEQDFLGSDKKLLNKVICSSKMILYSSTLQILPVSSSSSSIAFAILLSILVQPSSALSGLAMFSE